MILDNLGHKISRETAANNWKRHEMAPASERRRRMLIPFLVRLGDQRAKRTQLFSRHGMPINHRPLECSLSSPTLLKPCPAKAKQPQWPEPSPVRRSGNNPNAGCVARLGVRRATSKPAKLLRQFP
jgi:hypothetical protein